MAELTTKNYQYIDKLLHFLRASWEELPQVASEIDQWDMIDQLDYIEEWILEDDRLRQLEQYAKRGAMSQDQATRYEELKKIIERSRPILQQLRDSDDGSTNFQKDQAQQETQLASEFWEANEELRGSHSKIQVISKMFGKTSSSWSNLAACFDTYDTILRDCSTAARDTMWPVAEANCAGWEMRQPWLAHNTSPVSSEIMKVSVYDCHDVGQEFSKPWQQNIKGYFDIQDKTTAPKQKAVFQGADDNLDYRGYDDELPKRPELTSAA